MMPTMKALLPRPLAHLACESLREPLARRVGPLPQDGANLFVREDVQERRLARVRGQRLLQSIDKDLIAGPIAKIGEHDRVPLTEGVRAAREEQSPANGKAEGHDRSGGNPTVAAGPWSVQRLAQPARKEQRPSARPPTECLA